MSSERFKGGVEMWRSHSCGRKEALLGVSRGRYGLSGGVPFLCEECSGSAHWIAEHWSRVLTLAADVMSQTDTLLFVFVWCGFCRSLFILRLPRHMAVSLSLSLSVIWPASPPLTLSIFMNVCSIWWKPRRPSRVWRAPTSNSTV